MNGAHDSQASTTAPVTWPPADRRAPILAALSGLFFLRVIGQLLVTYRKVTWLPAVEHWQSGLLPYPILLAFQGAILGAMGALITGVWRGRGRFAQPRPRFGRALRWFGGVYFASMIVRYVVTMAMRPQWRWFGHTIPMIFHCVLATFLMVYSKVLADDDRWT